MKIKCNAFTLWPQCLVLILRFKCGIYPPAARAKDIDVLQHYIVSASDFRHGNNEDDGGHQDDDKDIYQVNPAKFLCHHLQEAVPKLSNPSLGAGHL